MKKSLRVAINHRFLSNTLLTLTVLVTGFAFWMATSPLAHAQDTRSSDPANQCFVCYKGQNKPVDCDKVSQFLQDHPGAYPGFCQPQDADKCIVCTDKGDKQIECKDLQKYLAEHP